MRTTAPSSRRTVATLLPINLALALALLTATAPAARADHRTLVMTNVHTHETIRIRPFGPHGRVRRTSQRRLDRFFRSWRTGQRRTMHPRLVRTLAHIQRHFGGRRIEIVSGYRAPGELGQHPSYHRVGRAADIIVVGVPSHEVFAYCRTLARVGCGYYGEGRHVHVDVRGARGVWRGGRGSGGER